ncbi:MAG: pentapeptide repeat-containing protein [Elainellaceae cyanobacterium]
MCTTGRSHSSLGEGSAGCLWGACFRGVCFRGVHFRDACFRDACFRGAWRKFPGGGFRDNGTGVGRRGRPWRNSGAPSRFVGSQHAAIAPQLIDGRLTGIDNAIDVLLL